MNVGILSSLCTVDYSSVDRALQFLTRLGRDTLLLKIDLKSAYRIVPLHPQDQYLFGVTWDNWVYVDQALPFGLHSAPVIFTAVADAIGWALLEVGLHFHIHYLDEFLFFILPAGGLADSNSWPLSLGGIPAIHSDASPPVSSLHYTAPSPGPHLRNTYVKSLYPRHNR